MLKKFPCELYKGTNNIQPYNLVMDINSDFVNNYTQYTSMTELYRWQNANITDVRGTVNNFLNYELINNSKFFYYDISNKHLSDAFYKAMSIFGFRFDAVTGGQPGNWYSGDWNVHTINSCISTGERSPVGYVDVNTGTGEATGFHPQSFNLQHMGFSKTYRNFEAHFIVFPNDIFNSDTGIIEVNKYGVDIEIVGEFNSTFEYITEMAIAAHYARTFTNVFYDCFNPKLNLNGAQASDEDPDNENGDYNDPNLGGDGDFGDPDSTDPTPIPDLPDLGASDFVKMYTPSAATLTQLAQFLWSADSVFDINNFKKIYNDPSECLVGLSIVPCLPASAGSKHIMFGNIDTEVSCSYVNKQWAKVDCGWKYIETLVKNFTDYSPFTKLQIFLPYIGFQHLNIDEVAGKSIHVVYHVDIISGDLVCFIETYKDGVIYSFSGNCLATVPVTSSSYGNFLGKYYSQLAQAPSAMINGAMQGGAAGAAMGGLNVLFNTAQTALLDRKATYSHSGAMSGAASIMGVQRPFVIIERPNISVPDYIQKYAGRSSNKTVSLGDCSGFTQVDFVHIDNVTATSEEIEEIERLLHEGVIL